MGKKEKSIGWRRRKGINQRKKNSGYDKVSRVTMIIFLKTGKGRYYHMEQNSLPKNIRQIGQADQKRKIYIEDYVITFARKLAEKNRRYGMAVLLGEPAGKDMKHPVFVKGAVEVSQWEGSQPEAFTNEIWSDIYEGVRKYFLDLEIVGWLFLRSGQEEDFDEKIKKIHRANFADGGNILFVFDREEREENFFRFENGQFMKQPGYYIYYEKNEPMQEYMIDLFGNRSQEAAGEDKVMEQVREAVSGKEAEPEKKTGNFIYAAGTALAAVVLVTGVTTLSNYDKVDHIENTLDHIFETMEDGSGETELVVETLNGSMEEGQKGEEQKESQMGEEPEGSASDESPAEGEKMEGEGKEAEEPEGEMGKEGEEEEEEKEKDKEKKEKEEKEEGQENKEGKGAEEKKQKKEEKEEKREGESQEAMAGVKYYIVKKGDTLLSISGAIYGSDEYVAQIQEMNQIDDEDMIYEGQKLIIP